MKSRNKRIMTALCALTMLAASVAVPCETLVNAGQLLGETEFTDKMIPWHVVSVAPAKQNFEITKDGELHVQVLVGQGATNEKYDLQVRHRNLNFKAGHKYTVSFRVKGKRANMELCSSINNITGDEEYCVLFGDKKEMGNGPHMGGIWGKALKLTTDWQEVTGTFECTEDLEGCEWAFQYARGTKYEGNGQDGDEIWFDDMSVIDETGSDTDADPDERYGAVSRSYSGLENNFISVNQVGYFPNRKKIAVLSDNLGDIMPDAKRITVSGAVDFEVIDTKTGEAVFKGTSSEPVMDNDSNDRICKLDFSAVTEPGTYYIKAGNYRSFDFKIGDDIYSEKDHNLLTDAVNFFYQSRSGVDIEEKYITSGEPAKLAHKGRHTDETALVQKIWNNNYNKSEDVSSVYSSSEISTSGGWYDGSDYCKYVVNGGMSVWTLQNMYERSVLAGEKSKFDDASGTVVVPETGNKIPDVLDEAACELDFISKLKVSPDEPEWGETAAGLYYHKVQEHKWQNLDISPWYYEDEWEETVRIVKPPTFAATLNYAACAAQAARLWEPYDSDKAKEYLASAIEAYKAYKSAYYEADLALKMHPDLYVDCPAEELNEKSFYAPLWQSKGGEAYGDNDVSDDAYWASCELFISASLMGDEFADEALKELESFEGAYEVNTRYYDSDNEMYTLSAFSWDQTASAGSFALALHKDLLSEKNSKKLTESIQAAADKFIQTEKKQGYGLPYGIETNEYSSYDGYPHITIRGYEYGSNSRVINNAIALAYAYDLTGESRYVDGVTSAMDYLLGTNPLAFSYVSGYGGYSMQDPYYYWKAENGSSIQSVPDGVLASGPSAYLSDPYIRALGFVPGKRDNPSQRCYVDSSEAYCENSTSAEYNASLAWVVSFLQDSGKAPKDDTPEPTPTPEKTPETSPSPTIAPRDSLGDVTLDGVVDVTDLTTLALLLVDKIPLTGDSALNADVTMDGRVDITDLAKLRQYLSKQIDKF